MTIAYPNRPRPLVDAATAVSNVIGIAGSLVTMLIGWGTLTLAQGDAVTGLLGLIPGAVTAVTAVLAAFGVVHRAEPLVTPVSDPRNDAMTPLVPLSAPDAEPGYRAGGSIT